MANRRGAHRAFTLIELAAIVAGIALIALVIVRLSVRMTCNDDGTSHARYLVEQTANDLERFKLHCGRYPTQLRDLIAQPTDPDIASRWGGPYSKRLPIDRWGTPLGFHCPGRHAPKAFDLWSFGPDRTSGTADDIANWN